MTRGPLGVSDEDFWGDPFREREAVIDALDDADFHGIVLDAPSTVHLDLRATLPVAGARRVRLSADDGAFDDRATLVAVRVESNEVFAARAFRWKEPAAAPNAPDAGPDGAALPDSEEPATDGTLTDFFLLDARERLDGLPWREGTLLVTVLAGDARSSTARVRLEPAPERDAAVVEFVARNRSAGFPRAVFPAADPKSGVPTYRQQPDTPTVSAVPALSVTVPRRAVLNEGARCIVRGAFALPVLEREIVKPFDAHADRFGKLQGAGWVDVGDAQARAVVPVTFVVCGEGVGEGPAVLRVDVPVYDPVWPGDGGAPVRGHFAVDLFALPEMFRAPGAYRVWSFSGEASAGPGALEILAGA